MPAAAVQNPPTHGESKSAKKKKAAKVEHRTESPVPSASPAPAGSVSGHDGQDDSSDNPYIRELQKNIRNLTKKITNAAKTDSLVEQHKGKSLEELVASKIINADQKAQRLKKPQLEAQLAQIEEQVVQYKKIDDEYRSRATAEMASLEKSLSQKLEKEKDDAINEVKEKTAAEIKKVQHDSLLVLSQFLRLAAARRSDEADAGIDENMALEGVLLNVYTGDENAVVTMLKLIEGSDEKTTSVANEELQTSYGQVKAAAVSHARSISSEPDAEATEPTTETTSTVGTDPTVANAGLTEIDVTGSTPAMENGHSEAEPSLAVPGNIDVADGAANAAAESQWDPNTDMSASLTQEDWVKVPRDPAETDTGLTATPAAAGNIQSWADDAPEMTSEPAAPAVTDANDGFHQVQRNRPRGNDRDSGFRGRGRGYRGRGNFGEGRGRGGRGRGRGDMAMRGGRRHEES